MAVVQYAKNICGMEKETGEYEKKAKRLSVLQISASNWKGKGPMSGPIMF